ncbi:MAG: hypothetical protein LBS43_02025 [Prevotellaceae bacterium]|jgi:hypothetical protein|nr:hypothetical protein [Prevotellaceae bacterium]
MKQIFWIFTGIIIFASCGKGEQKQNQRIDFGEIAPQLLMDSSMQLQATASSGLPVSFVTSNSNIAAIIGNTVKFISAGKVYITAQQRGNEQYYEASEISRELIISDRDPNKKTQKITFDLPAEWILSRDNQMVELNAVASSGLPVRYSLSSNVYGRILNDGIQSYLYLYHAGEGGTSGASTYKTSITVTASQSGNDEYNPADNVECSIRVTGDVFHN